MREHALALKKGESGRFSALDELPGDWWSLAENEPGGYQYRTVVQVLGKRVECMLDGCAGANHVTEELLVGMLNGIASGAPVPLKGAAVLRVTLLEGKTPEEARAGPEIFVRCKIAARGSSDWHGLILGGRALDCASRMGLGFRPGPEHHILDTLSIRIPRCEDYTRVRKDRAYAFEARLSSLDGAGCSEPGGTDRELLRYSGAEPLELAPGDGVLVPVEREVQSSADGSLTEAVFPVDCGVEAVPGLWTTGPQKDSFSSRPRSSTTRSSLATLSQRSGRSEELPGVRLVLQDSRTAECLHSRRCFQRPGCCYRPVWVRLIRAPSGGPHGGHLPGKRARGELVVGCTRPQSGGGVPARTSSRRLPLRTSLLRPACCSGRATPGACGTLGTSVAARAWRSVGTSLLRSALRSSGRGAARSGQAGSKARRRSGLSVRLRLGMPAQRTLPPILATT